LAMNAFQVTTTVSVWTEFVVDFEYLIDDYPDIMNITIVSSNPLEGYTPKVGSKLWVDNITMEGVVPIITDFATTFMVRNQTSSPVANAVISINAEEHTTDASGNFTINLENGTHPFTVWASGYQQYSSTVVVNSEEQDVLVSLISGTNYTATFNVSDGTNPIENAMVSIMNINNTTNAAGITSFSLTNGSYGYEVEALGYISQSGNININNGNQNLNIALIASNAEFLVTFNISDGLNPIEGANILIDTQNLTTNVNGQASISLQMGSYPYTITATNYSSISDVVDVVSSNVNINKVMYIPCYYGNFPFVETFEDNSDSRDCWTQIFVTGTRQWTYGAGAIAASGSSITTAHGGVKNARFTGSQYGPYITKLVSPTFDLTRIVDAKLDFWYGQQVWQGDQNYLRVYYRISPQDDWVQIFSDETSKASWTYKQLDLPNASTTYQVAFEGVDRWGYSNVLDDVSITGTPTYRFSIVVNPSGTGTVSPSNIAYYPAGQNINISATPIADYRFVSWTHNGTIISTDENYSFNMLAEDVELVANFEPESFSLNLVALPSTGGYCTQSGSGEYSPGDLVTITANSNTGYGFVNWTIGTTVLSTSASYVYTMPNQNVEITANFEILPYNLTLTVSPTGAGTVSQSGAGVYTAGELVNISTTPNSGYVFLNWTVNGAYYSSANSFDYTMPSQNVNMVANYTCMYSSFPFEESFEDNSDSRNCWSQEFVTGTNQWTYATGSNGGAVNSAYQGTKNARFTQTLLGGPFVTKLISPVFDLSALTNPRLSFWYAQERTILTTQNELKVYYRTSIDGQWNEIFHDASNVNSWKNQIIDISVSYSFYQIAFEGIDRNGRANVIDMVSIYDDILNRKQLTLTIDNSLGGDGNVNGGGLITVGEQTLVLAIPDINSSFAGWYYNGNLHTSQQSFYYVMPDHDVEFVAKFSSINTVSKTNYAENIMIYPNPNNGSFTIKANFESNSVYKIYSITGELLFEDIIVSDSEIIEMNNFAKGVYFIHVSGSQKYIVNKIVVN